MRANVKRGLNRLFAVLTPIWIVYCLIVYPMQRYAQAEKVEKAEFQSCWQESKPPDFKACADYARLKAGTDMWSLRAFYNRESWFLLLVVLGVPFFVYAVCRVLVWVWHGFMPA
jgi:hypothetical protein